MRFRACASSSISTAKTSSPAGGESRPARSAPSDLYILHNWDIHTPIEETMAALDDLVRAGKVRYLGVSDTPAWKIAQAQVLTHFRGWSPFISLQIEYSLLERTVEQELVPMAKEFGLGITPWSPLKSGVLSGKFTRANHGQATKDRAAFMEHILVDKTYDLIDELAKIARAHDSTVARIAIAWLVQRPGVTSTLIGARRIAQLEDNLKALDVKLTPDDVTKLDALTKPTFGFPQSMEPYFPAIHNGGTSVNGVRAEPSPFVMLKGETPY